jgi:molybdopterin molybdotransferase
VIILTGGVSAGDTDFIPKALTELGGEILFHRLPIRPGKPVLVGLWEGKLVVGLPGNPVSAAVVSRVIAQPLLQRLGGVLPPPMTQLSLAESDDKRLNLVWYRLVELDGGHGRLVDSRGSGDLVSLSRSHGFIEQPAGQSGRGPWRTWLW